VFRIYRIGVAPAPGYFVQHFGTALMRILLLLVCSIVPIALMAQADTTGQAAKLEEQRAQSGVDPTRVLSRAGFSQNMTDPSGDAVSFATRLRYTMGFGRWSVGMRQEFISRHSGEPGTGFPTGRGDLRLSLLNAFYVKKRVALAASADLDLPTGSAGFSKEAAVVTAGVTFSYTIKPTLIFAIQPQYTFAPIKDAVVPEVSMLTVRSFLAHFSTTGWFYVFEPRPVFDLANERTNFVLSPIIGRNLAKGYSFALLAEFSTAQWALDNTGNLYLMGLTKNF
jgi:hypothetical protein